MINDIIKWLDDNGFSATAEGAQDHIRTNDEPASVWASYAHQDIDNAEKYHNDYDDPPEFFQAARDKLDTLVAILEAA